MPALRTVRGQLVLTTRPAFRYSSAMKRTARSQPILHTKLQAPRPKPDTLRRTRLLDLLGNQLDRRLLVITGDAGYGKTTLLAQVREQAHLPCVFISLEQNDSDLVTFFSCLVLGLERLQPGLATRCQGLVDRGTDIGTNYRLAMGTLLNELVEKRNEELFIFLDDYHVVSDDSEVHQALDYFIDHLPAAVHVVIASRKEPPLPSLPKWRAKRDLAELSREALRFTEQDIKALLAQFYTLLLSETEIKGILQKTEGWITGVQLILHSAKRDGKSVGETLNAFLDQHGDLFRYFAGEIFDREKAELRDFLRRSSVLDVMTPDACRHILQIKEPARQLDDLANSNLFVTAFGAGEYRYHRLFREFLYDQLTDPGERTGLHARAAEYFKKRGETAKAIEQYLDAGRHREAVALIGQERERMINRAQFSQLRSWLDRLAPETYREFPWLYAVQAALCKEQGKLEQVEACYQQAEQAMTGNAANDPSRVFVLYEKSIVLHRKGESKLALAVLKQAVACCPAGDVDLKISILGFSSQVWLEGFGDNRKAHHYLDQARNLLKGSPNSTQHIYIEQKKAALLERTGEKRQAFKVYQRIIEQIGDSYFHLAGSYFHNAAKLALDLGKTAWAEECLNQGQALCRGYEDVFSRSMLEFGYGYLHLFKGDWDKAQQCQESALGIFREMNWTRSVCIALRQLGRLHRYRGDHVTAMKYIDLMKQQAPGPLDRAAALLEQALIETARGDHASALESLESCQGPIVKSYGRMGEIYCYLVKATTQAGLGKKRDALKWLQKALPVARDFGYDGLLSCELRASDALRGLAQQCADERAYLLSIPPYDRAAAPAGVVSTGTVLRVELLGPPRLRYGDKDITVSFRRQALQLLCFLAHHGERGASRDEILQAMWPKVKPKQAVDNFHLVLFEVRQGLQKSIGKLHGKTIVKEAGRYRIGANLPVATDVQALEKRMVESRETERAGDAGATKKNLNQALSLQRGEFCSGWTEDWVQGTSRRLEDMHQTALLKLGALHFRDGELETSRECYALAVQRDELCEEGYRGLIRIYGAQGNRIQAKAAFSQLQKVLRKEVNAEPASETIELYRTVMAADT